MTISEHPGTEFTIHEAVSSSLNSSAPLPSASRILDAIAMKATLNALENLESPEQYAVRLGKSVDEVMNNYTVGSHVWNAR